MKDCTPFAPMLGARPGELSSEEEARFHAHLASCSACQARLANLNAADGMVADALPARGSPEGLRRLRRRGDGADPGHGLEGRGH